MKVNVKDFAVTMDVGNKGITLDLHDPAGKKHLGDLRIGRGTIEWCTGSTHAGNGVKRGWKDLIAWFEGS